MRISTSYQRQDCSELRHISIQVAGFCPSTTQTWSGLICSVPSLASVFRQSKAFSNQRPCLWRIVEALTAGCLHTHALVLAPGVDHTGLQAQGSVEGRNILEGQRLQALLCYAPRLISASIFQDAMDQLQGIQ